MGKHSGKIKKPSGDKSGESGLRQSRGSENSLRAYNKDTAIFISMSRELKDEGNHLFQKRDYEGAMLKYDKAIKLLPRNHIDVSHLRSNTAECYMQLGISEYPRAIHECNLALEVTLKYSKALLKRARYYEALNKLDLALRDVGTVLNMEPNNLMALEIQERVNKTTKRSGKEIPIDVIPLPEPIEPPPSPQIKVLKEKTRKKKEEKKLKVKTGEIKDEMKMEGQILDKTSNDDVASKMSQDWIEDKKKKDKLVVEEEKISNGVEEEPKRTMKLVFGEDIRWAQIPLNCNLLKLREIISDRFPSSKAVLVKYRDQEGDLVTITTTKELRWAKASTEHGSVRLYIVEVNPDQDPLFQNKIDPEHIMENGKRNYSNSTCLSDWVIQFAQFFKNYVGFDTVAYLDLHEVATKLYLEAIEETDGVD